MESFSSRIERPLIPFLKEQWTSQSKYPTILIVTFLYGVYVVMFGYCTIILAKRKVVQRIRLGTLIALFLLASGDIAVTLYFFFRFGLSSAITLLHEDGNRWSKTLMYKFAMYIVANAIASGLLISRCYTVWQNKRILIAPIVLAVCGTGIGFASITATHLGDRLLAASFITSAAANLGVTLFIALRMWWSLRKVRLPRMDLSGLISFVASLILDTGAIYSLSIFFYLVLHTLLLSTCLTQVAGITVTAIILRSSHTEPFDSDTTFATTATPTQLDMRIGGTMNAGLRQDFCHSAKT
jgi:hypothetical protein